ncbi:anti-sigma factor family protein [Labrys wisconsinensis]|uniref:Anti-sigma factor RsiW n=1 Tax=Labrys wisconsinensis TaxID=425677 RepID=A0ABU0J7I1_9HYPH|nr:anti-sigma factor [Labrys wisconsinensis]MDQ0470226.1 anti-sigma factor RsiW [Labrys wisconsinensis]
MTTRESPIGEDDLHAYVDGRILPDRVEAVEAYLKANPEAASQGAAWRTQRETLRDQLAAKASEPIPARLRISNIRASRRHRQFQQFRLVAASALLLVAGGTIGWIARGDVPTLNPAQPVMVSDAISAYRTFVVDATHPVEVKASEQDHLVQWLSNRLGKPIKAPDLTRFGFRLMGGRLLPASADDVAAQLMYDDDRGTRLTLYLRNGEKGETDYRFLREGNVSAFYWIDDGLGFALSAAASRERLLPIVEAVYRQIEQPK